MEGILFDVVDLRHKIGVDFALKKNFTGKILISLFTSIYKIYSLTRQSYAKVVYSSINPLH
jgi:hypothetical protein